MEENLFRELAIGAGGSVIGAGLVFLFSVIYRGAWSAAERRRRWQREVEIWSKGLAGPRQGLTNEYLFGAIRWLFAGNLLWLAPELLGPFTWRSATADHLHLWLNSIFLSLGLLSFFIGLGVIVRYMRLRRTYDPLRLDTESGQAT